MWPYMEKLTCTWYIVSGRIWTFGQELEFLEVVHYVGGVPSVFPSHRVRSSTSEISAGCQRPGNDLTLAWCHSSAKIDNVLNTFVYAG